MFGEGLLIHLEAFRRLRYEPFFMDIKTLPEMAFQVLLQTMYMTTVESVSVHIMEQTEEKTGKFIRMIMDGPSVIRLESTESIFMSIFGMMKED